MGTLTYRYRPPTYQYGPRAARPKNGAAETAVTSVVVEHHPPTAAELRTHTSILWVTELAVVKTRQPVDHTGRVVAAYRVGVAPNRVRRFPHQYSFEWADETFAYYAAAGMDQAGASGRPPVPGAPPPVPRHGRPPPVHPAKGCRGAPQAAVGQGVA